MSFSHLCPQLFHLQLPSYYFVPHLVQSSNPHTQTSAFSFPRLSRFFSILFVTARVSVPCNIAGMITTLCSFSFTLSSTFQSHSTPITFLQLFHPADVLFVTTISVASHLLALWIQISEFCHSWHLHTLHPQLILLFSPSDTQVLCLCPADAHFPVLQGLSFHFCFTFRTRLLHHQQIHHTWRQIHHSRVSCSGWN